MGVDLIDLCSPVMAPGGSERRRGRWRGGDDSTAFERPRPELGSPLALHQPLALPSTGATGT
jgi:hypothetical protein